MCLPFPASNKFCIWSVAEPKVINKLFIAICQDASKNRGANKREPKKKILEKEKYLFFKWYKRIK